jgi:hypothetical protein
MVAKTYNDAGFNRSLPSFTADADTVTHEGGMDIATLRALRNDYPQFDSIFVRLWQNYDVIACSTRYRFNLLRVMMLVLNRLGPLAVGRFQQFLNVDALDELPLEVARTFRSYIVIDPQKRRVVHDAAAAFEGTVLDVSQSPTMRSSTNSSPSRRHEARRSCQASIR